jgi:hypothetical protein
LYYFAYLDKQLGVAHVRGNVVHEPLPLGLAQDLRPEGGHLREVVVVRVVVAGDVAADLERRKNRLFNLLSTFRKISTNYLLDVLGILLVVLGSGEGVREVVGCTLLALVHGHGSVALIGASGRPVRAVDRDLSKVGAETIPRGVVVAEKTSLQHLVGRGLDAGHQGGRREGQLLHLGKVVPRVTVEDELADLLERVVFVRPHLGQVKRVEGALFGLRKRHDLDVHGVLGIVALGDRVVHVPDGKVGIALCHLVSLVTVKALDALVGLVVELDVVGLALSVDHLEGVGAVAVHVAETDGGAAVGEEERHLVGRLGAQGDKVPEHVGVLKIRQVSGQLF